MSVSSLSLSNSVETRKDIISERLLIIYILLIGTLTFTNNSAASPIALVALFLSCFYNKYLSTAIYISTLIISPGFSAIQVLLSSFVISIIGITTLNNLGKKTIMVFVATSMFVFWMLMGAAFGTHTQMVTILLFAFRLYLVVFIIQMVINTNEKLILNSLLYSGLAIAAFVGYNFFTGNVDAFLSDQGRLEYQDNIKTLATSIVVPIFISLNKLLNKESRKRKVEFVFYGAILIICLPVLLLTYARGVTFGLIIATFLLMLFTQKRFKFSYFVIYLLVAVVVAFIAYRLEMSQELWFDNLEGGNGRTDIYKMHYNYMLSQGPGTVFWGYGSDSMKDIIGRNTHSTILAYFFHFGVGGILFALFEILITLIGLFKKRKCLSFYLCLFILSFVMFSGHGGYESFLYYVIMGLCLGMSYKFERR